MEARYFRILRLLGVGYKARTEADGRLLCLELGYNHEVELAVSPAVRVFCFKPDIICCDGIDKARTHQFAAAVRSVKPHETYKEKGICYKDEVIKLRGPALRFYASSLKERNLLLLDLVSKIYDQNDKAA